MLVVSDTVVPRMVAFGAHTRVTFTREGRIQRRMVIRACGGLDLPHHIIWRAVLGCERAQPPLRFGMRLLRDALRRGHLERPRRAMRCVHAGVGQRRHDHHRARATLLARLASGVEVTRGYKEGGRKEGRGPRKWCGSPPWRGR